MEKNKVASAEETNGSVFKAPTINLPKGGGAIRGMGEKFAANPVTGTGSMTIPIATSPGRSGFGPQLNLSYDSGYGNSPFGFGWSLSLPAITRKTDKGLPQYNDAEESDVYILSGAEDLVPEFEKDANGNLVIQDGSPVIHDKPRTINGITYNVRRYRPRVEGLFARIERWTRQDTGEIHWRSISRDNVTTLYGLDNNSRIFDPVELDKDDPAKLDLAHPKRIFSWLICQSYDDKGNAILYDYIPENEADVDFSQANERNRIRFANRYLKHIYYGNRSPYFPQSACGTPPTTSTEWLFEVVFDYGEHDPDNPTDSGQWICRNDPFSSYRSGFEIRTYRLCQRVLMFHRFDELGEDPYPYLVRSTDFMYRYEQEPADARNPIYAFLVSATQTGYRWDSGQCIRKSLPPLEFKYSPVFTPEELTRQPIQDEPIQDVDSESLENLPVGLDGASYQWIDLDGEGASGILTEQAGCWYYKRNLSANHQVKDNGHEHTIVCFGATEVVARKPMDGLGAGAQFLDLAGDGQVDLVQMDGPVRGFYERTNEADWEPFRSFDSWPNINIHDPNLKFADLTGDGHADILITESEALTWHPSLAEKGFGPAIRLSLPLDEDRGPRLVFADGMQSIYLADLSGDGLTDLVRIRNGEICYWPNLGYGRFGAKVTMDNAPLFDAPDQFNQQRIHLADIDGSGTTDIIYLRRDSAQVYFNQSGNRWSDPVALPQFPPIDSLASVQVVDLLSNGTACLIWSSSLPGTSRQPMRYLVLMPEKPHLLVDVKNNLGAETKIQYAPSTKFYLNDRQNGKPWITRLPFPVHVVEQVEVFDHISRNHFVTRYAYHHGYFDGAEREFRGFGMVEQWDTDEFDKLNPEASNVDYRWHTPPVHTKTWFHTGAFIEGAHISQQMAHEYFGAPQTQAAFDAWVKDTLLDDTVPPSTSLTTEEIRQACRALKGVTLRQEIYADDDSVKADIPYSVSERNYTVRLVQEQADNRHAVFFTHARETVDYHYERNLSDPRVSYTLTVEVDDYGNVLKSVAIGYGRRQSPLDDAESEPQTTSLIVYTDQAVTNAIDSLDHYRTPLPFETRTYELTGFDLEEGAVRFSFDQFASATLDSSSPLDYEQTADIAMLQKRLIEHVRTLYRRNDLTGLSPLGEVESLALPGENYKQACTSGLLDSVYKRKRNVQSDEDSMPDRDLVLGGKGDDQGGYVKVEGKWWIPSGRVFYDPAANMNDPAATAAAELGTAQQHFFLPRKFVDPFDQSLLVDHDVHDLLVVKTQDALLNTISAQLDYRVLQPWQITDPNGNRAEVAFDALGLVVGTAMYGKETEDLGGNLSAFDADLLQSEIDNFHDAPAPHALARTLIKDADTRIVYDLHRFYHSQQAYPADSTKWDPPYAATLARETHASDPVPVEGPKIQISFSYSDGFGREIQKKIQAEPGLVEVEHPDRTITIEDTSPDLRWVGSGWTIFNNKGKPVRQYEPFFSTHHHFQYEKIVGVSPMLFYDPLERVVATLHPNNTYEKVVFDPWQQKTYDVNDTLQLPEHPGDPPFDPKDDPDAGQYFRQLPEDAYLPTWYDLRTDAAKASQAWPDGRQRAAEKTAAEKAALHASTPTIAHFDALGRAFLTIADNGKDANGEAQLFKTRVVLDIEGNQREVIDAKGRAVMHYDYDMLGSRVHQSSMEAGERWMLNDVTGKPIRAWDSRGFMRRMAYDELRRPIDLYVTENGAERLAERTLYGEMQGDTDNLKTHIYQVFDAAGIVTNEKYDFKGNLERSRRDLIPTYQQSVDWLQNPIADDGSFLTITEYDALNRPTAVNTPDNSLYHPIFNEANLLNQVNVNLRGAEIATSFVTNIDYNARGQRTRIEYGNGALTSYEYDPLTFKLIHLLTVRGKKDIADCAPLLDPRTCEDSPETCSKLSSNRCVVQDLHYTYDPVGNITHIRDDAQQITYFRNKRVEPTADYAYDPIYRLIEATGREHLGQTGGQVNPPTSPDAFNSFHTRLDHPGDGNAMGSYMENYTYDEVGNMMAMWHRGTDPQHPGWTRSYAYDEASLLEPASMKSNRLSRSPLSSDPPSTIKHFDYDAHGNMTKLPHLPAMKWDFEDQLQQVVLDGGWTAYYVYDVSGQRVRKVIHNQNGNRQKERIYLGGYEIYREFNPASGTRELERETLHIMDDQQRIALVETKVPDTNTPATQLPETLLRYQLGNHLGSASLELDDQARIISYEEYYPYGSTSYQAVRSQAEAPKRYRYTGKERDEESGLYYHGARYYAPWLGRWVSCDPIGLEAGIDLFIYASGNPLMLVDASGRAPGTQETLVPSRYPDVLLDLGYDPGLAPPGIKGTFCTNDPSFAQKCEGFVTNPPQQTPPRKPVIPEDQGSQQKMIDAPNALQKIKAHISPGQLKFDPIKFQPDLRSKQEAPDILEGAKGLPNVNKDTKPPGAKGPFDLLSEELKKTPLGSTLKFAEKFLVPSEQKDEKGFTFRATADNPTFEPRPFNSEGGGTITKSEPKGFLAPIPLVLRLTHTIPGEDSTPTVRLSTSLAQAGARNVFPGGSSTDQPIKPVLKLIDSPLMKIVDPSLNFTFTLTYKGLGDK